jgi:hypothetical protein
MDRVEVAAGADAVKFALFWGRTNLSTRRLNHANVCLGDRKVFSAVDSLKLLLGISLAKALAHQRDDGDAAQGSNPEQPLGPFQPSLRHTKDYHQQAKHDDEFDGDF